MVETDVFLSKISKSWPKVTPEQAYKYGLDCGRHGVDPLNCHFSIFATPENTAEWERGKRDATGSPIAPEA